jgi:predicted ester cyclase
MRFAFMLLTSLTLSASPCQTAHAGTADNVRIAKRVFLENLANGRFERLDEMYAPNFVAHGASVNHTLAQDTAATKSWHDAIPDLKVTVERTVADRDMVAVHWMAIGINTVAVGEMPGKGARIGIEGMTFFRFSAGRIVEEWSVVDIATLRNQLD